MTVADRKLEAVGLVQKVLNDNKAWNYRLTIVPDAVRFVSDGLREPCEYLMVVVRPADLEIGGLKFTKAMCDLQRQIDRQRTMQVLVVPALPE